MPEVSFRMEIENLVAFRILKQGQDEILDSNNSAYFGQPISLKEIMQFLLEKIPDFNQKLKSIKGGIKTLLLQNSQLFKILQGKIHLKNMQEEIVLKQNLYRNKSEIEKQKLKSAYKTRKCWFYQFHPQGCLLDDDVCPYLH